MYDNMYERERERVGEGYDNMYEREGGLVGGDTFSLKPKPQHPDCAVTTDYHLFGE